VSPAVQGGSDSRFGIADLVVCLGGESALAWLPGTPARAAFSTVSMSSLPDGRPPMRPGGLFVAIQGMSRDGHDFVADAFANGAVAALVARVPDALEPETANGQLAVLRLGQGSETVQRPGGPPQIPNAKRVLLVVDDPMRALQQCASWWRRRQPARVLAVTGSVGKTTTKDLLANILSRHYRVLRTEGSFNNELGLPLTLLQLTAAHERAALEIGISEIGEMEAFATIAVPDVAIVTRVAPAHMQQFGDLDTVEREKGHLVAALPPGGVAVLNADDARVARMAERTGARVVTYGETADADVRATEVTPRGHDGLAFRLHRGGHSEPVFVKLSGRHFTTAALAAAAAAFDEGCTWDEVIAGLAENVRVRRLQPVPLAGGVVLLDDSFNASPAATVAALDVLAACRGRRWAVLGDMLEFGAAAAAAHREVGRHVPGRADELVLVGELAAGIGQGALEAGFPASLLHVCQSNSAALDLLRARLAPGDFVLVKGSHSTRMDEIVRGLGGASTAGGAH
jgi:UDP-N-acetylmuramoyl-tripeptide--D-alanyl-D-alanine ligase